MGRADITMEDVDGLACSKKSKSKSKRRTALGDLHVSVASDGPPGELPPQASVKKRKKKKSKKPEMGDVSDVIEPIAIEPSDDTEKLSFDTTDVVETAAAEEQDEFEETCGKEKSKKRTKKRSKKKSVQKLEFVPNVPVLHEEQPAEKLPEQSSDSTDIQQTNDDQEDIKPA